METNKLRDLISKAGDVSGGEGAAEAEAAAAAADMHSSRGREVGERWKKNPPWPPVVALFSAGSLGSVKRFSVFGCRDSAVVSAS